MADWQSQIVDVDVAVEPVTPQSNVFSLAAHVATVTFGSSGDIFRVATGVSDLDTWLAAGEIDAAAHAAGATAFAQTPSPARWMLIKYATAYADSLTAVWNTGARFLYYTIEARTAADATSAAGFASGRRVFFMWQSSDTGFYGVGTTYPAGWTALAGSDQFFGVWHATDAEYADVAIAARASAVDPDVLCFSFVGPLGGTITPNNALTPTQVGLLQGRNLNTVQVNITNLTTVPVLRFGIVTSGEKAYAILSKFWTEIRLSENIVGWFQGYDAAGVKAPGGDLAETQIESICVDFIVSGQVGPSPHFGVSTTYPSGYSLTVSYNVNTRTVSVTGVVVLNDATDVVDINLTLVRA
jgi:hypothetical protein